MKTILELAREEIEKEIKNAGFICDSDNTDRFLDNLVLKLRDELIEEFEINIDENEFFDKVLSKIREEIMSDYILYSDSENGNFEGYYTDKEYTDLEDFKEKNNLNWVE